MEPSVLNNPMIVLEQNSMLPLALTQAGNETIFLCSWNNIVIELNKMK